MHNLYPEGWGHCRIAGESIEMVIPQLQKALLNNETVEGLVHKADNKFNLYVSFGCIQGLIPYEEVDISDQNGFIKPGQIVSKVNTYVQFKVKNIVKENGQYNILLSRKEAILEAEKYFYTNISIGDRLCGIVTNTIQTAAFISIGAGITGYLHITDVSVARIRHISEMLSIGDKVEVLVKSIDEEKQRITLTHKELLGSWEQNAAKFNEGETVTGIVREKSSHGIFIELMPNLVGLAEFNSQVNYGDKVPVYIKKIVPEVHKIKLAIVNNTPVNYPNYKNTNAIPKHEYFDNPDINGYIKCAGEGHKPEEINAPVMPRHLEIDPFNQVKKKADFVDENDIEAKVSPFAIREREKAILDNIQNISMSRVVFNVNAGYINEIHIEILKVINELKYVTVRQIFQILTYKGIPIQSQTKVSNRLEILVKNKLVNQYHFESDVGKGIFRTYSMAQNGAILISNWDPNYRVYWKVTNDMRVAVHEIKRKLASNQVLLAFLTKVHVGEYKIQPILKPFVKPYLLQQGIGKANIAVKPLVYLTFPENNNFIFEVVRRNNDWEKEFEEANSKYYRYAQVLSHYGQSESGSLNKPTALIFVGEDLRHAYDIYKKIITNNIYFSIPYYFTCDLFLLGNRFDQSIFSFTNNDCKIEITNFSFGDSLIKEDSTDIDSNLEDAELG